MAAPPLERCLRRLIPVVPGEHPAVTITTLALDQFAEQLIAAG